MLIYEKNDIQINELHRGRGYFESRPLEEFLSLIHNKIKFKEFSKLAKKYYFDKLGMSPSKVPDSKFIDLYNFFGGENNVYRPKELTKYDSLTGFAYYLGNKLFKLNSGGMGLNYFVTKGSDKDFYFFDPIFEIFVGKISTYKANIKGNSLSVQTSAAERKLIGMGYGLKMYLSILENCDYLMSSSVLFTGSFRIWAKVLPKYCKVWYKDSSMDTGKSKIDFVLISPEEDFKKTGKDIDYFVASIYHKKI
jgi:hypothetical protein